MRERSILEESFNRIKSLVSDLAENFDDSAINFVKTSGMAGYDFAGESVTITKPESAPLTIDSATGAVTLNEVPDYETCLLYTSPSPRD